VNLNVNKSKDRDAMRQNTTQTITQRREIIHQTNDDRERHTTQTQHLFHSQVISNNTDLWITRITNDVIYGY